MWVLPKIKLKLKSKTQNNLKHNLMEGMMNWNSELAEIEFCMRLKFLAFG